jgi:predicted small secreted protein
MVRHFWISAIFGVLLIGSAGLLAGCNTTAGAGKDLSATGRAITHEADENKSY